MNKIDTYKGFDSDISYFLFKEFIQTKPLES